MGFINKVRVWGELVGAICFMLVVATPLCVLVLTASWLLRRNRAYRVNVWRGYKSLWRDVRFWMRG